MPTAEPLTDPATPADRVLTRLHRRGPTLGAGRLLCLDGPAGSGKSTLAAAVARRGRHDCRVVTMDDLYAGWQGLDRVEPQLAGLLRPLAAGRPGSYRRWDWHRDTWAEQVTVPPAPLLVLEGVGAGAAAVADLITLLVFLDAPLDVRRDRGLARDGAAFAPHWEPWARAEGRRFARDHTRERADLLLTTG